MFRIAARDGTAEQWATDDPATDGLARLGLADASWRIEAYHRGVKQVTNVERCPCRVGRAQRGHIGLALRALVVVERWRWRNGVSWWAAKRQILHEAIRGYRANPLHRPGTA